MPAARSAASAASGANPDCRVGGVEQAADEGRADDDTVREARDLSGLAAGRDSEADADRQVGGGPGTRDTSVAAAC